jgi:hypothetical protein
MSSGLAILLGLLDLGAGPETEDARPRTPAPQGRVCNATSGPRIYGTSPLRSLFRASQFLAASTSSSPSS